MIRGPPDRALPHAERGAAANPDLFCRNYTRVALGAAGAKWTGDYGFGVPGYPSGMVVTKEAMEAPCGLGTIP